VVSENGHSDVTVSSELCPMMSLTLQLQKQVPWMARRLATIALVPSKGYHYQVRGQRDRQTAEEYREVLDLEEQQRKGYAEGVNTRDFILLVQRSYIIIFSPSEGMFRHCQDLQTLQH
jgi:hypothetical protein